MQSAFIDAQTEASEEDQWMAFGERVEWPAAKLRKSAESTKERRRLAESVCGQFAADRIASSLRTQKMR